MKCLPGTYVSGDLFGRLSYDLSVCLSYLFYLLYLSHSSVFSGISLIYLSFLHASSFCPFCLPCVSLFHLSVYRLSVLSKHMAFFLNVSSTAASAFSVWLVYCIYLTYLHQSTWYVLSIGITLSVLTLICLSLSAVSDSSFIPPGTMQRSDAFGATFPPSEVRGVHFRVLPAAPNAGKMEASCASCRRGDVDYISKALPYV